MKSMADIYCVSKKTVPIEISEVEKAQSELQTSFPEGYLEWASKLGEGDYSGYLRPYHPARTVAELEQNRSVLRNDFWDDGELKLSMAERTNLIVFADTIDADLLAFNPADPRQIFVFPRNDSVIYSPSTNFLGILEWVKQSGKLVEPFTVNYFQPWNNYASLRFAPCDDIQSPDDLHKLLLELGEPDHFAADEECLDYFIQNYGLHISGSLSWSYSDVTVHLDTESTKEFLPLLSDSFKNAGFRLKESNRVDPALLAALFTS